MTWPAIRVEALGKRYCLGARRSQTDLRQAISDAVRRRFSAASADGDDLWALRDVHFSVSPGETVGIIGGNGSGKTTLLQILARITAPTEGRAEVRGRLATLLDAGAGFHGELTGLENIYLQGAILGMPRPDVARRVACIAEFAGLQSFLATPLKRFSAGMCARLAFAVAAHLPAEILLIDEVLAAVDADFQQKCTERLAELARQGRTLLVVSHDPAFLAGLATRCLVFRRGKLVFEGEPREAWACDASPAPALTLGA